MQSPSLAISVSGITKEYFPLFKRSRKVTALNDVSINVERGRIYGLLGQNGAGKTTLIKILLGLVYPTSGSFQLLSETPNYRLRKQIGYLPENPRFPAFLKGIDALRTFGKMYGMEGILLEKKIDEMLDLVKLRQFAKFPVRTYSKGMQQRLGLAQAVMHDPELILLDEPTDGVDPIGRKEIRDILLQLKSRFKTIFINSHILSEVELITDQIAILNKGRLIKEGSVDELTSTAKEYFFSIENLQENQSLISALVPSHKTVSNNQFNCMVNDISELNILIDKLRSNGIMITEIQQSKMSLEDAYIRIVKASER
jgi:ABC-2 type transport system ATP-binding protein